MIYLLLYGLQDKVHVSETRHCLVLTQFVIFEFFMAIAFITLAVALLVATQTHGPKMDGLGIVGVVLIDSFVLAAICMDAFAIKSETNSTAPSQNVYTKLNDDMACLLGSIFAVEFIDAVV